MNKKRSLSIQQLIIITFIFIFVISAGVLTFLNFYSWKRSIDKTITEVENNAIADILKEIDEIAQMPMDINMTNYNLLQNISLIYRIRGERPVFCRDRENER